MFNASKGEYEHALNRSGCIACCIVNISLSFHALVTDHVKRKRHHNIIWFNLPYSRAVIQNVAKKFLQLLDLHFPPSSDFWKIFNNNVQQGMWEILSNHTTRNTLIQPLYIAMQLYKKIYRPLEGKCRTENIVYKCIVSTSVHPDTAYLGTADGDFKKRYYNHISSFTNKTQMNKTTLAKYVWELELKQNITPTLKWYIGKSVPSYSNIANSCILYLHKKFEILTYPNQDELLNKRSELVSKCRHVNKYLLSNYKAND